MPTEEHTKHQFSPFFQVFALLILAICNPICNCVFSYTLPRLPSLVTDLLDGGPENINPFYFLVGPPLKSSSLPYIYERVVLLAILAILTSHFFVFTTPFYDFLGSRAVSGHRVGGLASRLSQRCTLSE